MVNGFGMAWFMVAAAMLSGPASAAPKEAAPDCGAEPVLPAEFAAWSKRSPITSGIDAHTSSSVDVGRAYKVGLKPVLSLRYAARPGKSAPADSFGGMLRLTISRSAVYRVALGSGGWVDVVKDGEAAVSSAHGPGPACSSIRKIVDFPLQPGAHVLQIAGASVAELAIMVITQP